MSLSLTLIPLAIGTASAISFALQEKIEEGTFYRIDTNMKDENLLKEALENYGCDVSLNEEKFHSSLGELQLAFQQQENGTFSAYFQEDVAVKDAEEFLFGIQSEYTRLVQKGTYEKLLARAKAEGLKLEAENRQEDDTIVLTFQVEENRNVT